MKKVLDSINGKKLPITAIIMVVGSFFTLQAQVKTNVKNIDKLEDAPTKIAVVQEKVNNIERNIDDFKLEQRAVNVEQQAVNIRHEDKLDKILEAVIRRSP